MNGVDWRLARDLATHDVKTAHQMGWAPIKNGDLLALAAEEFDVFMTIDRNLSLQHNFTIHQLAVVVLSTKTNRFSDLRVLVPKLLAALPTVRPGVATHVTI